MTPDKRELESAHESPTVRPRRGSININQAILNTSDVRVNVAQRVVVTTEDKIRLTIHEYGARLERRDRWTLPAGLLVSVVLTLLTAEFKPNALGLTADVWKAIFVVLTATLTVWLAASLIRFRRSMSTEEVIERLMGP